MASALAVFFTWVVIASIFIGAGSLVLTRFNKDCLLVDAFWMGLSVSVAFLEIWNLLRPITSAATILLCGVGVLGLLANRRILLNRLRTELQTARWFILLGIAIVMFMAFRACGPCDYSDTGLYGAQAVRWIMTYPVVPGLVNVHGRLGFNSSVFLCLAALDQGVWKDLAQHLFTGFLMAAIWVTILPALARVVRGSSASPADWFHCILAIPMSFWAARSKIVGTLTDEPAAIACLVATGILFDELRPKDACDAQDSDRPRIVVAMTLFALAVAFKESTAVFALLAWCLAFSRIWLTSRSVRNRKLYMVGSFALSSVILLPWCVRGIILSGYPFFPAAILGFPVDWKAPLGLANWYRAGIRSWGQDPDALSFAATQHFAWLGRWLTHAIRNRSSFQVPLAISLGGLAVALGLRIRRKSRSMFPWLWLLLPSLAGLVFWFLASPDLRFAQFAIWTTAGTLGTWGIASVAPEPGGARVGLVLAALLGLMMWCLAGFGWKEPYRALFAVKSLPRLPKPGVMVRHTLSGLAVYVPTQDNKCWDAPLPCTPYFDETLRLRDGQSMRWGFVSEGQADFLQRFELGPIRQPEH